MANANDKDTLTIDRFVSNNLEFSFPNDKGYKPKSSDFDLINYVVMSNEYGERWAVLTLTNLSSGNRVLERDHIMATFADGEVKSPLNLKLDFEGKETQSITVSFGKSKFPILSIKAETEK
ncbi:hypothetical protein HII17_18090 [Thalassotalea sp. M1531]|uniref:Uncharacterized protein n=2 Tax=Thalassotalea algicola TaxID=2716224 RepID=A0A7Y0LFF5_9GAMM|nr:hypothetical protein [Thalassotalea algicola]